MSADWQPQLFGLSRRCNVSEIRERSTTSTYAREREELITPMGFRHAAALNGTGTRLKRDPKAVATTRQPFNSPEGLHTDRVMTFGSTRHTAGWPGGHTVCCRGLGAGEGNRTLVCSLGSCRSTIELRPQVLARTHKFNFRRLAWRGFGTR